MNGVINIWGIYLECVVIKFEKFKFFVIVDNFYIIDNSRIMDIKLLFFVIKLLSKFCNVKCWNKKKMRVINVVIIKVIIIVFNMFVLINVLKKLWFLWCLFYYVKSKVSEIIISKGINKF